MTHSLKRRQLLAGAGAAFLTGALEGCSLDPAYTGRPAPPALQLARLRASPDRITGITVCTRPFRAQGPRLEVEQAGQKTVVHNYGHGGSGWSLSWGSGGIAVEKAMAAGERDVGVIGCGALGITSALLLQRAGARVTIYAKDLPPNVRSSLASGLWTPDSRICLEKDATPEFKRTWERMTRESYRMYQTLLGMPGDPVEFIDNYFITDAASEPRRHAVAGDTRPEFAFFQNELVPDLRTHRENFDPGSHTLGNRYLHRTSLMMFNIPAYQRMLMSDFLANGGKIEVQEFHTPADFARLPQKVLINATGYGARALFKDESLTPVRGQLARMIPQPEMRYGMFYKGVSFIPRRDGMVFQVVGDSDYYGYDDETTVPDRAEAELAVNTITGLFNPPT
jgi:glycine/D-amino acid oxidase-like deaminating enzyme